MQQLKVSDHFQSFRVSSQFRLHNTLRTCLKPQWDPKRINREIDGVQSWNDFVSHDINNLGNLRHWRPRSCLQTQVTSRVPGDILESPGKVVMQWECCFGDKTSKRCLESCNTKSEISSPKAVWARSNFQLSLPLRHQRPCHVIFTGYLLVNFVNKFNSKLSNSGYLTSHLTCCGKRLVDNTVIACIPQRSAGNNWIISIKQLQIHVREPAQATIWIRLILAPPVDYFNTL